MLILLNERKGKDASLLILYSKKCLRSSHKQLPMDIRYFTPRRVLLLVLHSHLLLSSFCSQRWITPFTVLMDVVLVLPPNDKVNALSSSVDPFDYYDDGGGVAVRVH
jgi:hypothetical protein